MTQRCDAEEAEKAADAVVSLQLFFRDCLLVFILPPSAYVRCSRGHTTPTLNHFTGLKASLETPKRHKLSPVLI